MLALRSLLVAPQLAVAIGGAVILDGPWRFTATTERLIRIEYDEDLKFVDEETLAFLRSEPLGIWESMTGTDGKTVLNTSQVSVTYRRDTAPGAGESVVVASRVAPYVWAWGDDPANGNLRGTARTLDGGATVLDLNCHHKVSPRQNNSEQHCTWGLVSKDGWAMVNETGAPVIRDGWFAPSRFSVDISVFLHGLDFDGALKDFFHAAGPPALPPRYAFGTMYTRWQAFDSDSTMAMVDAFDDHTMPLDAWIFDMNWHTKGPWGAFSWNHDLHPDVQSMLAEFQSRGLFLGANMHEHSGFLPSEDKYLEICAALGREPGGHIPFDLYNKTYAMVQETIAVQSTQTQGDRQGIDFSWIDYQQGESHTFQQTHIPGLNPTIVLNKLRSDGPQRRGENNRSMILSRWGGLGSHRYPVGFSGDNTHNWEALAFLSYFTCTAANVGYNYWSHDTIGGKHNDYELSVRWTQMAVWSPVFRYHDKGTGIGTCAIDNACDIAIPWELPSPFWNAIRSAAWDRDALVPYIYTAAWANALGRTGAGLVQPMYYEDPADAKLYGLDSQFLFGPDMIVSPICAPSAQESGFEQALGAVQWSVYAPSSQRGWVDRLDGEFHSDENVTRYYGINDVPGLVRQGAVIPLRPGRKRGESSLARAMQPLSSLEFRIMPAQAFYQGGTFDGHGSVVDDDGLTLDYLQSKRSITELAYEFSGRTFVISLSQTGDFDGRPHMVSLKLSFPQLPPMKIISSAGLEGLRLTYDHQLLGPVLTAENVVLTTSPTLILSLDPDYDSAALSNFIGSQGRVRRARYIKEALVQYVVEGYKSTNLTTYVLAARQMSPAFASNLGALWKAAQEQTMDVLDSGLIYNKDIRRYNFVKQLLIGQTGPPNSDRPVIFA